MTILIPADIVTDACTTSPLSVILVLGFGGLKLGDNCGKLADFITAWNCTEPSAKNFTNDEPLFTNLKINQ